MEATGVKIAVVTILLICAAEAYPADSPEYCDVGGCVPYQSPWFGGVTPPTVQTPTTNPPQTGMPQTGPPQTGMPQTGPPQTGMPQTGPPQTGMPQTGPPQTGMPQTGPPQTGPPQTDPSSSSFQPPSSGYSTSFGSPANSNDQPQGEPQLFFPNLPMIPAPQQDTPSSDPTVTPTMSSPQQNFAPAGNLPPSYPTPTSYPQQGFPQGSFPTPTSSTLKRHPSSLRDAKHAKKRLPSSLRGTKHAKKRRPSKHATRPLGRKTKP